MIRRILLKLRVSIKDTDREADDQNNKYEDSQLRILWSYTVRFFEENKWKCNYLV